MNTCQHNNCGLPIPKNNKYCGSQLDIHSCTAKADKEAKKLNRLKNPKKDRAFICENCSEIYISKHRHAKGLCGHSNFRTGCAWDLNSKNPKNIKKAAKVFKPKYFLQPNYQTGEIYKMYYDESGELKHA